MPPLKQAAPVKGLERENPLKRRLVVLAVVLPKEVEGLAAVEDVELKPKAVPHLVAPLEDQVMRRHDEDPSEATGPSDEPPELLLVDHPDLAPALADAGGGQQLGALPSRDVNR